MVITARPSAAAVRAPGSPRHVEERRGSRAARIGSSRPSVTARSRVARASATYDAQGLRRVRADVVEVGADGADVAAHDRPGQRGVAVRQRVVEGGGQQRPQGGGRVVGAGRGREQLHRLGDQGDQVVGAVRQPGVVERALRPRAPTSAAPPRSATSARRAARARRPRRSRRRRSPASRSRSTAVPVKVIAGCIATTPGADRAGGLEHGEAVPAGGVHDVLALAERAAVGEHRDDVGQHVVGDGEQQQVAGAGDGGRLARPAPRAAARRSARGEASDSPAAATTSWPAAAQARRQDRADAAGAHDTARACGIMPNLFRSSPSDHLSSRRGRCRYRTTSWCSTTTVRGVSRSVHRQRRDERRHSPRWRPARAGAC